MALSRKLGAGMRHELHGGPGKPRLAVVTCRESCAHEVYHLQHLAADLDDRASAVGPNAEIPEQLPGVPLTRFTQTGTSSLIQRDRSRDYGPSTVELCWDVPFDETTATALVAHTLRLIAL
ncbi:hypothetical protein [Streptomyces sp. NPDC101455]|uniref:hypothetical protein n=1 Tax=Streptomyces sp. NPDC101455 TaxID=3366142 RepID=UPI00381E04D0